MGFGCLDVRWELEAFGGGTRLTLWHNIDRRFISMGAAGWHICFDVLDRHLSGTPIGRIVGGDAMKFGGWQRLNAKYAKQFGIETPNTQGGLRVVNRGGRKRNGHEEERVAEKQVSFSADRRENQGAR